MKANKIIVALATLVIMAGLVFAQSGTPTHLGAIGASATGIYTNDINEIGVKALYADDGAEAIIFSGSKPVMAYPYQTTSTETNMIVTGFYQEQYATNGINPNGTYSMTGIDTYTKDGDTNAVVYNSEGAGKLDYASVNLFQCVSSDFTGWFAVEDFGAFTNGTTVLDEVVHTNDLTGTYGVVLGISETESVITNADRFITIKIGDLLYDIPARLSGN